MKNKTYAQKWDLLSSEEKTQKIHYLQKIKDNEKFTYNLKKKTHDPFTDIFLSSYKLKKWKYRYPDYEEEDNNSTIHKSYKCTKTIEAIKRMRSKARGIV